MNNQHNPPSRRQFLRTASVTLVASHLSAPFPFPSSAAPPLPGDSPADYTLHIRHSALEIAPKHIVSATTYNGACPGPLLRFKEGQPVTVDICNDTDTPEQLHWHGQRVPVDVDGAA
jgi:FtsP/CotA-like multicopper oxidase with cupredoxin domain